MKQYQNTKHYDLSSDYNFNRVLVVISVETNVYKTYFTIF